MTNNRHILLFDGVCNLCNNSVQFVIKNDKAGVFKFASLQSQAGEKLLAENGLASSRMQSFVYLKNNTVYTKSDAALEVAKTLGSGWKLLYGFKIIPRRIRDHIYHVIAKNRYKWFGKKDECMVPAPHLKARFL